MRIDGSRGYTCAVDSSQAILAVCEASGAYSARAHAALVPSTDECKSGLLCSLFFCYSFRYSFFLTMPRGKTLKRQSRKMLFDVYKFMAKEAEKGVGNLKAIRTAAATRTSLITVKRIVKDANSYQCFALLEKNDRDQTQ